MGRYDRYREEARYVNPYKDYDWDNDGFPGEYVYGDDCYIDPEYGEELWKRIDGFPEYWISDYGRVYSSVSQIFLTPTPGKKGHLYVSLYRNGERYRKYIHRLVAEAFMTNPDNLPMVRHMNDVPSCNELDNLECGTQVDNMRDCIRANRFRYFTEEDREMAMQKRRTPVTAVNLNTGEETEYISQQEAARILGLDQSSISAVLRGVSHRAGRYYFYYTNNPKHIDVKRYKRFRQGERVRAIDLYSGESYVYRNQTEAARALGMSISSISQILSGKLSRIKGYTFESVEEDGYV